MAPLITTPTSSTIRLGCAAMLICVFLSGCALFESSTVKKPLPPPVPKPPWPAAQALPTGSLGAV